MRRLRYPELWRGCVLACSPGMGATGGLVKDYSQHGNNLTPWSGAANKIIEYRPDGSRVALYQTSSGNAEIHDARPILDLGGGGWGIGCWVRIDNTGVINRYILSSGCTGPDANYAIMYGYSSGKIQFYSGAVAEGFGYPSSNSNMTPVQGQWHHVFYTYDTVTYRGYLDGVEKVSYVSSVNVPATGGNQFKWGGFRSSWGGTLYDIYPAYLDDLRIYRRCPTATEVMLLASRRCVAYDTVRNRRSHRVAGPTFKAAWLTSRQSQIIGGGVR